MKILVQASNPKLLAAAAAMGAETFSPALAARGDAAVLLEAGARLDADLQALVAEGLPVVVVASVPSADVRATALAAGATDVVFPPFTAARLREGLDGLLGRAGRRHVRFETQLKGVVEPSGEDAFQVTVRDVSRRGARVVAPRAVEPGALVRAGLALPAPTKIPVQYARVVGCEKGKGGFALRLRLLGLLAEDEETLVEFLRTLEPPPVPASIAFAAVDAMGPEQLLDADAGAVAGVKAPPLMPIERAAIIDAETKKPSPLVLLALARVRAQLITSLVTGNEALEDMLGQEPERLARWREELRAADTLAREMVSEAIASGDIPGLKDRKDLHARLVASSASLDRLIAKVTGREIDRPSLAPLEDAAAAPAVFERKDPISQPSDVAPAKPRGPRRIGTRLRWLIALNLVAALLAGVAWFALRGAPPTPPQMTTMVAAPAKVFGRIHVKTLFRERDATVFVVDGTWYHATDQERRAVVGDMQREGPTIVRDLTGAMVAYTTSNGRILVRQDTTLH